MPSPYLSRIKLEKELEKRAQAIKEKRDKSAKYLKEIEEGLKLLSKYIDVSKYSEEYKKASDAFNIKDFDKALSLIEPLLHKLSEDTEKILQKEEKRIKSLLSSGKIKESAKIKADLEEAKSKVSSNFEISLKLIEEINSQISSSLKDIVDKKKRETLTKVSGIEGFEWVEKDLSGIKGASLEVLDKLDEIDKKIEKEIRDMVNKNISEAQKLIELTKSAHYNLPVDESKINDIEKALDSEDYITAIRLSKEYLNSSKDAFRLFFTKLLDISNILIQEGVSMGEDMSGPLKILDEAKKAYDRDDLDNAIKLVKKATEEAEKIKLHKVLELIKISRDKLLEAKNNGIDIKPYLEMIESARNFIKIGKHKKAYDTVSNALQKIERKINLYSQLKTEVKELRDTIEKLKEENIILEGVTEKLESIESTLDKNPEDAEKMIDELKTIIKLNLREIANTLHHDLSSIIGEGESVNIDLRSFEVELENTEKLLKDENYKDAIVSLRKIEERLYESIFNEINRSLEEFKKYGEVVDEKKIESIRTSMENGEIHEALSQFKEIKEEIFRIEAKKYEERIKELENSIKFLKELGEDTTKIEDYLSNAREALKEGKLQEVEDHINECSALIDSLSRNLAERAYELAKDATDEASKMKIDIEKNGILSLLNKAAESLKNKEYQEVIRYTAEIDKKIKELKEKMASVKEMIEKLSHRIEELKEKNLPSEDVEKLLKDATKSMEDNDFDLAQDIISQGFAKADEIEFEGKITAIRNEIEELGKIMRKFNFKEDYIATTEEFFLRYRERRYEGLEEIGKKVIKELRKSVEIIFNNYLNKLERMVEELQEIGLKIDPKPLRLGKEKFWSGNIGEAFSILEEFEKRIKEIHGEKMELRELENRIGRLITLAISLGIDTSQYTSIAKEIAEEEDGANKKERLKALAANIEKEIQEKIDSIMKSVESELDGLRRKGINVTTAEAMIARAKNSMIEKNYKKAFTLTLDAMEEIENIEMQKNTAYGILKIVERKIGKMRGLLPKDILEEYKEARILFLNEKYKETINKAMDISEKLWDIERIIDLIREKNSEIKIFIQEAKKLGIDMKKVLIYLAKAKKDLQNLQYTSALKFVNEAYKEASRALENVKEEYRSKYEPLIKMLIDFDLKDEFEDRIAEIDKAFEDNNISSLESLIPALKEDIIKEINRRMENLMQEFREKKELIINSGIKDQIDLEKEEKILENLRKEDAKKFLEYYEQLSEKINEIIVKILKNKLEEFQAKLQEFEDLAVNVSDYKERIGNLLERLEEMGYKDVLEEIKNIEDNFKIYIEEYSKDKSARALSIVSKYDKKKAEEFSKIINEAIKNGDFLTAIKKSDEAIKYVGDYRIKISRFNKKAMSLKDLIKYGLAHGANMDRHIKQLKEILSSTEELDKAIEDMNTLENDIKKEIDKLAPKLDISILSVDKSGDKYIAKFKIKNEGNADARNISILLKGALNTDNPINIPRVSKGSEEIVEVLVKEGEGNKIDVKMEYQRFDEKSYENEFSIEYKLKKKGFHIEKNKEKVKCAFCRGTILPGLDIVICDNCGAIYHLPCAKRAGKCIKCGTPFNFE